MCTPPPGAGGGGLVLPMMAYTGQLLAEGYLFKGLGISYTERVGISLVEVIINKRVGKSVIWVCEKDRKG